MRGWTGELPGPDLTVGQAARHMGLSESQEVSISPEMFGEFIFPYQLELQEKFGLNCYGCCEPVDRRWKYIKQIPGLRRISVSPWSNEQVMAQLIGDNYIYSRKTPPTWLAAKNADEEVMEAGIKKTVEIAGRNLELIMKDNHTIGNNPNNCISFVKTCRKVINCMC